MTSIFINSLWGRGAYFFEAVKGVGHPTQKRTDITESGPLAEVELLVPKMVCEGCAETIRASLTPLSGVREVKSKVPQKRVYVRYEPTRVQEQHLKEALDKAGFTALEA